MTNLHAAKLALALALAGALGGTASAQPMLPELEHCDSMYYAPQQPAREFKADAILDNFCANYPDACIKLPEEQDYSLAALCQPFSGVQWPIYKNTVQISWSDLTLIAA